tara:strand:- start:225 stop:431 length:207 start_codon:yes stop_codon:yes gene_type:complete
MTIQLRKTYTVEVSNQDAPFFSSPNVWKLYANYQSEHEAHQAIDDALNKQNYKHARLVITTTFENKEK